MSDSFINSSGEISNLGSMNGSNHSLYSNVGNTTNVYLQGSDCNLLRNILHINNNSVETMLRQRISDLERIILDKDEIIKCKDEIICAMKIVINK